MRELTSIIELARHEKLTWLILLVLLLMLSGSTAFYFAERGVNERVTHFGDAIYWGVVSATTTGYGDVYPITPLGRAASITMLLSFMGVMPLVWATITTIYVSKKIRGESGLDKVNCEGHLVICGWNNNGNNVLAGLAEERERTQVVIVAELTSDHVEDLAQRYPQIKLHYVRGQYSNEATLQRANVRAAKAAIVLSSYGLDSTSRSDDMAVLAVLALRELAPGLRIVAECFSSSNRVHLRRAGADRVIVSGELDGYMLTAATFAPGLDLAVKDALTFGSGTAIWTHPVPPAFVGKSFKELARFWLEEHTWVLIGLVRPQVKLGVENILSGDQSSIDEFISRRFELAGRGRTGSQHLHYLNPGAKHVILEGDVGILIYPGEGHETRSVQA